MANDPSKGRSYWPELLRELVIYARELREATSGNADDIDPTSSLGRSMAALELWDLRVPENEPEVAEAAGTLRPYVALDASSCWSIAISGTDYDADIVEKFERAEYVVIDLPLRVALIKAIDTFESAHLRSPDQASNRHGRIDTITISRATAPPITASAAERDQLGVDQWEQSDRAKS